MTQKATRAAVQAAYDSLVARDIPPTYEAVRDQIGGGSMTTIARHLRQIAAGSSPSASLPPAPSAPPSDEAPVDLPLEWLEAADGLSRTVARIMTRTIAEERERAVQLLDAEAAARTAAVTAARVENEALRRALEESRARTETDFDAVAAEVEALQGIVAILLATVELEPSDDPDDLRAAAAHAIERIRERTEAAARIPTLELDLQRWQAEARTAEARIADLRDAAAQAELRHQGALEAASRVPALEASLHAAEARIAALSAQAVASAEIAGRAKALEEVVVQLTSQLARAVALASAPPVPPRSRPAKHAGTKAAAHVKDSTAPAPETTSADQPLANLVLAAPSPVDDGASGAPTPSVAAA